MSHFNRITQSELDRVLLAFKKAGTPVRAIRHLDGSMSFEPIGAHLADDAERDLDAELRKFEAFNAG